MKQNFNPIPGYEEHAVNLIDTLDVDRYPSDETLRLISTWNLLNDADNFLNQIKSIWAFDTISVYAAPPQDAQPHIMAGDDDIPDRYVWVRFATVGWSGNESILAAMEKNIYLRMFWYMSVTGGLTIYRFPKFMFN